MRYLVKGGHTVCDNKKHKQAKIQIKTQHSDLNGHFTNYGLEIVVQN